MSLSGDDRAFAIYKSIPGTAALSGAVDRTGKPTADQIVPPGKKDPEYSEKYKLLQALQGLWGADTTYLQGAAEIAPGSLAAAQGIPVSTAGGPAAQTGTTTGPGPLSPAGRGRLL